MFSNRTSWQRSQNRLTDALDARRAAGKPVIDLTVANPTECSFIYPGNEILQALSDPLALRYQPDPRGLLSARKAVAAYYAKKSVVVDPQKIFLTASSSEAYSFVLKLLCDPGDEIVIPTPSYPLFDYLTQLNDVQMRAYHLEYDHEWCIDFDSVRESITAKTRAIILISPHNPTGMFLQTDDIQRLNEIAAKHNLALISDEVFADYLSDGNAKSFVSTAGNNEVLTFTLNGISKLCGLPQMKLGWIVVSGNDTREAEERLEIICDTYLSVNTPVQVALPKLLKASSAVQAQILDRIRTNSAILAEITKNTPCSALTWHGGWYGIIQVPRTKSDEEWALLLLNEKGILVSPGYFFDFAQEGFLVVSLLEEEAVFRESIRTMLNTISSAC